MILFKPYHVQPILDGRKTQTRRKGKKRWNVGAIHQAKTTLFGEPFARLRILHVRTEELGYISSADVVAEGYRDTFSFMEAWTRIHGKWDAWEDVWVIDFEPAEEAPS